MDGETEAQENDFHLDTIAEQASFHRELSHEQHSVLVAPAAGADFSSLREAILTFK